MKRYLCVVQYLGKNYSGYQRQKNAVSIQQKIEEALETAFSQKIEIFASGRTDAGVNALAQTFHFDAELTIPAEKIPFAVNQFLPEDIKILSGKEVDSNFNARFDIKKKTYVYNTYVSPVELPIKNQTSYWLTKQPNVKKMKQCAKVLLGEHNFKAFMSAGSQNQTFVRTLYSVKIIQSQNDISFEFTGSGFLYNMVRILVGTLLEVGYGKKTKQDVEFALKSEERKNAGYLVPPHALFLKSVEY